MPQVHKPVVYLERRQYKLRFSPLPIIARNLGYSADDNVSCCRSSSFTNSFVTPFQLWNDVSIFYDSGVISTSGAAAMLPLTIDNMWPISQFAL